MKCGGIFCCVAKKPAKRAITSQKKISLLHAYHFLNHATNRMTVLQGRQSAEERDR
jgi:hypothetical protein